MAKHLPHHTPAVRFCPLGHGTGIHNQQICLLTIGDRNKPLFPEPILQKGGFRLIQAATYRIKRNPWGIQYLGIHFEKDYKEALSGQQGR